jgi:elongator complex protein 3
VTRVAYSFEPDLYEAELSAIIDKLAALDSLDARSLQRILREHPKDGRGLFSKSEIVRGFRHLRSRHGWTIGEEEFLERIRMKPIRTASGVAPVTVLTKPYPCPGRCIFCPSDVRMPKSYLSDEPGAQRAAQHRFDPYAQSLSRVLAYHNNGHRVDKVELIILGGTWSYYPETYQIWFVKRCFEALNDFEAAIAGKTDAIPRTATLDFRRIRQRIDGRSIERSYNRIVTDFSKRHEPALEPECATWSELDAIQRANEVTAARCVGLVVETRPDHLTFEETVRMRRLGVTKVQIGYQSLSDEVLRLNHRGHDVAATRRAMKLLRQAGFKIHAHWMPNLYGSSPEKDIADYRRMFSQADFRPDELKIYPCSLIESAELMAYYEDGRWRPYDQEQLLRVLSACMAATPEYCRLTRVIRDIPGTDIVAGNRLTNFREIVERDLDRRGVQRSDIRSREIGRRKVTLDELDLRRSDYSTSIGREVFLQYVTRNHHIAAFLRLSLPDERVSIEEIEEAAMIREVHVYGVQVGIGHRTSGRSQHLGLGRRLIEEASVIASAEGFSTLAVISSVGTREYYRSLGFTDGEMYQHRGLRAWGLGGLGA